MVETEKSLGSEKENDIKVANNSKVGLVHSSIEMALMKSHDDIEKFEENKIINYTLACSPQVIIQEVSDDKEFWFNYSKWHCFNLKGNFQFNSYLNKNLNNLVQENDHW